MVRFAIGRARLHKPDSNPGAADGDRNGRRYGLETLWTRDITVTTGLVDTYTIPRLMKLVASGRLDPTIFATHRFPLGDTMSAYDAFGDPASTHALKVVLQGEARVPGSNGHIAAGLAAAHA